MFEELREISIETPKQHIGGTLSTIYTTLDKLYIKGWWITEIFGSYANIVKKSDCMTRKSKEPYFICLSLHIKTPTITPKAMRTIKKIKNKQWKQYGKQLTTSRYG